MIGGGLGSIPQVVRNLLILNVLFFVFASIAGLEEWIIHLGLFYPTSPYFEPYQIVTHFFMHGGLAHLFFNMFALWMLGSPLEHVWGPKRFFIFYMVTALGAALCHLAVKGIQFYELTGSFFPSPEAVYAANPQAIAEILNSPAVGASGAIFGILCGFGMLFPNTRLMLLFPPIPIKAKYFVIGYAAIELFLGLAQFQGDNIAHFAHLGGALFGFILVKIWQRNRTTFY